MRIGDTQVQTREEAKMSESIPANNAKSIPQITALSTAFPMHFESSMPRKAAESTPSDAQRPRQSQGRDAGE